MNENFIVQINEDLVNSLIIHTNVAAQLKLKHNDIKKLKFGLKSLGVKINISMQIKENVLELSKGIVNSLKLPLSSTYQLTLRNDEIIIGPFIGILFAKSQTTFAKKFPQLVDYVHDYSSFGGTIVAFSLDQILDNGKISGLVFNPNEGTWEKSIFPYPSAVLIATGLPLRKRILLEKRLRTIIINSRMYNKWQCYKLLSPLKEHLPETSLYNTPKQIFEYLHRYKSVYVKPIQSTGGYKIKKLYLNHFGKITVRNNSRGYRKRIVLRNYNRASLSFKKALRNRRWIIQQPIDLLSYNNSLIDFRCIVVKDEHGNWKDMGVISKYGTKGNIVTNILSGGVAEMAIETIKKVLNLPEEKANELCQEISNLSIQAVQSIESAGGILGTAGIDIGIDKNQKLWIIEVNLNNPQHDIAVDAKKPDLYQHILKTNMLYLKYLAGFKNDMNEELKDGN
jgi:glutathione synthase/RimK-type ligase-like ATP-grasp enzyme